MTDGVEAPADHPLFDGYLTHLSSERRLAALTVENYARDVRDLLELVGTTAIERLTVHDIRRFVARLHAQGLGGRSLARKLSAWRGFFDYLARDHGLTANPAAGLKAPRSPKRLPASLTPDEAASLLDGADEDALPLRDRAMFELIYSSGLRLAEVLGVRLEDIDLAAGTVRVLGKGSKTRVVPVGAQAIAAVERWLPERALMANAEERVLFVSRRGGPLHPRTVQARAGTARPRQHLHHPGVHASRLPAPSQGLRRGPPARAEEDLAHGRALRDRGNMHYLACLN
jgi:integrase/recombinase XerC